MKKLLLPLLLFALVGCEKTDMYDKYLLHGEQADNFSVATRIYQTREDYGNISHDFNDFPPVYTITFADSYRCQASFWVDSKLKGCKDYYYELKYPYISIYSTTSGVLYGWKHIDGNWQVGYLEKDELIIEGLAGILRFSKDTTEIIIEKPYADFGFFYQEATPMVLQSETITDPDALFPIPDIP